MDRKNRFKRKPKASPTAQPSNIGSDRDVKECLAQPDFVDPGIPAENVADNDVILIDHDDESPTKPSLATANNTRKTAHDGSNPTEDKALKDLVELLKEIDHRMPRLPLNMLEDLPVLKFPEPNSEEGDNFADFSPSPTEQKLLPLPKMCPCMLQRRKRNKTALVVADQKIDIDQGQGRNQNSFAADELHSDSTRQSQGHISQCGTKVSKFDHNQSRRNVSKSVESSGATLSSDTETKKHQELKTQKASATESENLVSNPTSISKPLSSECRSTEEDFATKETAYVTKFPQRKTGLFSKFCTTSATTDNKEDVFEDDFENSCMGVKLDHSDSSRGGNSNSSRGGNSDNSRGVKRPQSFSSGSASGRGSKKAKAETAKSNTKKPLFAPRGKQLSTSPSLFSSSLASPKMGKNTASEAANLNTAKPLFTQRGKQLSTSSSLASSSSSSPKTGKNTVSSASSPKTGKNAVSSSSTNNAGSVSRLSQPTISSLYTSKPSTPSLSSTLSVPSTSKTISSVIATSKTTLSIPSTSKTTVSVTSTSKTTSSVPSTSKTTSSVPSMSKTTATSDRSCNLGNTSVVTSWGSSSLVKVAKMPESNESVSKNVPKNNSTTSHIQNNSSSSSRIPKTGSREGDDGGGGGGGEGGRVKECPLCQVAFSTAMSQMDIDSHIAACLSVSDDDIVW